MWKKGDIIFSGWLMLGGQRIFNPADEQLIEAGYTWFEPEPITPVRTFSKFKLWVATREMPYGDTTVWDAFKAFLNEAGLWEGYSQLVDLVEDNEFFEQMYPVAVQTFGEELVNQVLAAAEKVPGE